MLIYYYIIYNYTSAYFIYLFIFYYFICCNSKHFPVTACMLMQEYDVSYTFQEHIQHVNNAEDPFYRFYIPTNYL